MSRGFSLLGLIDIKDKLNVGGIIRAAHAYNVNGIITSGGRYKGARTDACKSVRSIPLYEGDDVFKTIPSNCTPVAVEYLENAQPLPSFNHPDRACYIFGAEDRTIEASDLEKCEHVVYIPTRICMNLMATVNVVLYDRFLKSQRR